MKSAVSSAATALRTSVRIQYASDLHLELYDAATFPLLVRPNARYLALCGDIGQPGHRVYHNFLSYASHNWDAVLYVPGRHEFYRGARRMWSESRPNLDAIQRRLDDLEDAVRPYKNIHLLTALRTAAVDMPREGIAFVGSTLLSPAAGSLHTAELTALDTHLNYYKMLRTPVCLLTASAPGCEFLSSAHSGTVANAEAVTRLCRMPLAAWFFGGVHTAVTGTLNGIFVGANARGYPNELVDGFHPTRAHTCTLAPRDETREILPDLVAAASGFL
jgi:hypothetical protein